MSSPKESSNPNDYIKAHEIEYENIIKYWSEEVLEYMFFHSANNYYRKVNNKLTN